MKNVTLTPFTTGLLTHSSRRHSLSQDKMRHVLLDLLTDNEPQNTHEGGAFHSTSHRTLRLRVLRDLQWLFNSVNSESHLNLSDFPHVRRSSINYGIPSLAGKRISELRMHDIQQAMKDAILHFEPRIMADGLRVTHLSDPHSTSSQNILSIEMNGYLWCMPYPLEFTFRSDIDLENGHVDLQDLG